MMRLRIVLIIILVLVATPLIMACGAYVYLRQRIITQYDACVAQLSDEGRNDRSLKNMVTYLEGLPEFQTASWNLNKAYDRHAINILIPNEASNEWHQKCGLPKAPADCLAAPSEQFIICNAAVGRQVGSKFLNPTIIRSEIIYVRTYAPLVFIGHELGHLKEDNGNLVRHLLIGP
jgi:hypothetical protein